MSCSRREWLGLVVAGGVGALVPGGARVDAQSSELAAVLAPFTTLASLSARFREEKRITLLTSPLVTEGVILYERPGRLARLTTSPAESRLVLDGNQITMRDASGVVRLDIRTHPVVASFASAFRAVLAGDEATLRRLFRVEVARAEGGAFDARLSPRDAALARILSRMRIEGRGTVVARLSIDEANGDASTMTFTDVHGPSTLSRAERDRVLGIGR